MGMGRRRKSRKDLPERVYHRHGAFYFVDAGGKWHRLGKNLADAMIRYAELNSSPHSALVTLGHVMDRYQAEVIPSKAPRTQKNYISDMRPLRASFGRMRPDDLTPQDIYAYMDQRPRVSGNREKALLSAVYSYAIRWGAAKDNPCRLVKRNEEKPRTRYVTDAEFWAVHDLAPPIVQAAMMLATITGLRLGDILSLRRQDLTDDGLIVHTSKTGKVLHFERTQELEDAMQFAMSIPRRAASVYILANLDGQKYTVSGFESLWQRVMRRYEDQGGTRFQFRDLRAKAGSDHPDGKILGHTNESTLRRVYRRRPELVTPVKLGKAKDK